VSRIPTLSPLLGRMKHFCTKAPSINVDQGNRELLGPEGGGVAVGSYVGRKKKAV
jgi:hypothetical protein